MSFPLLFFLLSFFLLLFSTLLAIPFFVSLMDGKSFLDSLDESFSHLRSVFESEYLKIQEGIEKEKTLHMIETEKWTEEKAGLEHKLHEAHESLRICDSELELVEQKYLKHRMRFEEFVRKCKEREDEFKDVIPNAETAERKDASYD
eukprot:TRINITY_DN2731_c0_g1_i1.p1 TRINITY_DN2731_c0_g1~~TRINITY_DN2731_c0_g1_i1.p1  ORF type:complete len:147 (-),score=56.50 TRINITY_DN2731_c0_g1_i1:203-643(-)